MTFRYVRQLSLLILIPMLILIGMTVNPATCHGGTVAPADADSYSDSNTDADLDVELMLMLILAGIHSSP